MVDYLRNAAGSSTTKRRASSKCSSIQTAKVASAYVKHALLAASLLYKGILAGKPNIVAPYMRDSLGQGLGNVLGWKAPREFAAQLP